tara:strand:+ start:92 stop:529 length:438 start_codon:yes stop_codon:yes gene_type:complete
MKDEINNKIIIPHINNNDQLVGVFHVIRYGILDEIVNSIFPVLWSLLMSKTYYIVVTNNSVYILEYSGSKNNIKKIKEKLVLSWDEIKFLNIKNKKFNSFKLTIVSESKKIIFEGNLGDGDGRLNNETTEFLKSKTTEHQPFQKH